MPFHCCDTDKKGSRAAGDASDNKLKYKAEFCTLFIFLWSETPLYRVKFRLLDDMINDS